MSESLSTFLVDLATDPELMGRFLLDPARELDRMSAGLTAAERTAILSQNSRQLREVLDARGDKAASDMVGTGGGKGKGKGGKKGGARKKPAAKKAKKR